MIRILFDLITLQDRVINGGMLYTQKIFNELLEVEQAEIELYGLYDGKMPIEGKIYEEIKKYNIGVINIRDKFWRETIKTLNITLLFIGIAQRYNLFDLSGLKCKIYIVCHDLVDLSLKYFNIEKNRQIKCFLDENVIVKTTYIKRFLKFVFRHILSIRTLYKKKYFYNNFARLIQQDNVYVITDSEYSKASILYFFGVPKNKIQVLYPPLVYEGFSDLDISSNVQSIVDGKKYFLLLSVDRFSKNLAVFLEQWENFCIATKNQYFCVLVGSVRTKLKNCIILHHVNSNELGYLYKNAFALVYPSFIEGFGFPPIEAAAYATPSICSNVTSIPEICGDMSIYFSPFYPEDLYRSMLLMCENREHYVLKAKKRYKIIKDRQDNDLVKLLKLLV